MDLAVKEILESMTTTMHQYIEALDRYTEEEFIKKPQEDEWSLGQVYEHLESAAQMFLSCTHLCLRQERGQVGGKKNKAGENIYGHNSFPPIIIKIPKEFEEISPAIVAKERAYYQQSFVAVLEKYKAISQQVEQDNGEYKVKHLALGMLNAKEWFQMNDIHVRHHLRQMQKLNEFLGK